MTDILNIIWGSPIYLTKQEIIFKYMILWGPILLLYLLIILDKLEKGFYYAAICYFLVGMRVRQKSFF